MASTSTDVAVRDDRPAGGLDRFAAEERRLSALMRECHTLAKSKFVPDPYKNEPETVFALARYGEQYGLSPIHSVSRLYVINGKIEPSADVLIALAIDHGHEVRYDETSSTRCTVSIRRAGVDYWQSLTWTIEDARRAGLLDVWVEVWKSTSGGKRYAEVHVVGNDLGIDDALVAKLPADARRDFDAGKLKSKDNWQKYPDDMLAAKAIRRAVKRFCPEVLLNLADEGEGMLVEQLAATTPVDDDDEPADAEILDDQAEPAPEPAPAADEEPVDAEIVDPEQDATQKGDGDDAADDEALPADQPDGSTPREGGVPAAEPSPAREAGAGDETATTADPEPAPAATPTAPEGEKMAPSAFARSFAVQVRETDRLDGTRMDDDDRHALVAHATGGRTRSTKEVWHSEIPACFAALHGVAAGKLQLVDVDGVRTVVEAG